MHCLAWWQDLQKILVSMLKQTWLKPPCSFPVATGLEGEMGGFMLA